MKARVYIRCDGSPSIGLGHVIRCMALAQMLKNDFEVIFFCKEIPTTVAQDITESGFELQQIGSEEKLLQSINHPCVVVLDGYHFDSAFQKSIKQTGAKLVCIDDLHQIDFLADLIVNQAPEVTAAHYRSKIYTHFALGPDYVLLRQPFLKAAREKRNIKEINSVLICFGGADPKNLTQRALSVAVKYPEFKRIAVVIGQAYSYRDQLTTLANADQRISVHAGVEADQMVELFLKTQLCIVPSSGVLSEAIAMHSCIISGAYIENQQLVYDAYKRKNAFVDAGNFSEQEINRAIETALRTPTQSAVHIDGLSGNRLVKRFHQLFDADYLGVRLATWKDVDITFAWASNPTVRAFSFQKHDIKREEHEAWFEKKVQEKTCVYFIVNYKGEEIGSVRYDLKNDEALISYLVDPRYHSKGLGLLLLLKSFQPLLKEVKQREIFVRDIVGYVMPENYPSRKTFVNLGFAEFQEGQKLKFVKQVEW